MNEVCDFVSLFNSIQIKSYTIRVHSKVQNSSEFLSSIDVLKVRNSSECLSFIDVLKNSIEVAIPTDHKMAHKARQRQRCLTLYSGREVRGCCNLLVQYGCSGDRVCNVRALRIFYWWNLKDWMFCALSTGWLISNIFSHNYLLPCLNSNAVT